jgi:hypothetical protein
MTGHIGRREFITLLGGAALAPSRRLHNCWATLSRAFDGRESV